MKIKRMGLSGVILFTIVSILQGCTILGQGTQQPTRNYVLNSVYSYETQTQVIEYYHAPRKNNSNFAKRRTCSGPGRIRGCCRHS